MSEMALWRLLLSRAVTKYLPFSVSWNDSPSTVSMSVAILLSPLLLYTA